MVEIFNILLEVFEIYFLVDTICLIYVWFYKEIYYGHKILFTPILFSGIPCILSDYKKNFREIYDQTDHSLL